MNVLNRVVELCSDIATVEATPNMEGRRMIMVIAPKPGVVRKAQEAKKAQVAAQIAAGLAAKKRSARCARRAAASVEEEEELDEDEINADVEDDEDEDADAAEGDGAGVSPIARDSWPGSWGYGAGDPSQTPCHGSRG